MENLPLAVLLAMACICACAGVQGEYAASKACPQSEACLYTYSANQASSMSGTQSRLDVRSVVEVFCDSVGNYGDKEATKYCLLVKETSLTSDDETKTQSQISSDAKKLLSGPFCFVQTEDGKIVSVHHNPDEKAQIVNFKKGIAAAFQANFKNTRVEVEEDTQSKHYSRYSYERIAQDHVIMHRVVDSESVIQFGSSALNGKPLRVERTEDVEYKEGKLLSSQGKAVINLNGPADSYDQSRFESYDETMLESNADTFDPNFGEGSLTGTGQYSLRLKSCSKKSRSFYRRSAELQSLLTASNLHAIVQRDASDEEMNKLRKNVPSVRKALDTLKANIRDATTSNNVRKLLILESERGPLSGYQPAISEVVDYLNSEKDSEMRAFLYSLLAAEGSAKSQEILLDAMRAATDNKKERESLNVELAFVRNICPEIVAVIENLIQSSNDTTDPLILSYGALAEAASPELRQRIVQFLQERVRKAKGDTSVLVHLIHSLGNTKSSIADSTLLQFVAHDDFRVRLAAVYALRYSVAESKDVQNALLDGMRNHEDTNFAEMVVRAMIAGAESKQYTGAVPVGDKLFEAIVQHVKNNTELRAMVRYYVMLLGPKAPKEWMGAMSTTLQKRAAWNDKTNALYDLVQDYSTRSSDITNYPLNKAYIWSKSFGVTDVKLDVAFGAFAGYGGVANPTSYKLFAKGIARGYAYGYTATAFEALILSEYKPGTSSITNSFYVSIVGKVLANYNKEIPTCKTWTYTRNGAEVSKEYTLLNFKYSVFVYVGTLDFSISLTAKLAVDASLTACINKCVTANAAVIPSVTVTATAGASVTLIEIARGGIDLAGKFQYQVVPRATGGFLLPKGPLETCLSLSHGWPDNSIAIYVYYQLRSVSWCSSWLGSYPCGFEWGDKRKWDAASKEWALPTSPSTTLYSSCDPSKLKCSA